MSADLENLFAATTEGVAETAAGAVAAGLAGFSIEDYDGSEIYELIEATERVAAAVEVAHAGPAHVVLTARSENHIRGRDDLDDTITRLLAYQEAGADVLYAPGLTSAADHRGGDLGGREAGQRARAGRAAAGVRARGARGEQDLRRRRVRVRRDRRRRQGRGRVARTRDVRLRGRREPGGKAAREAFG